MPDTLIMSNEEKPITGLILTERPSEVRARFEAVIGKPDILERICEHVANGGSLVTLCRMWAVSYRKVMNWIKKQPNGLSFYNEALEQRKEWAEEMVLADLHNYSQADVRDLFDDNGELVQPNQLGDEIGPAIQSIQIKRKLDESGSVETTYDYKLVDKLKARDMLLRTQGKYVDKHEHSGSVSLVDIVAGSYLKDVNNPNKD
jgi:hypothetical protein